MSQVLEVSTKFEQDERKLGEPERGSRAEITQLREARLHYKPLWALLQSFRRVHVGGSFVLLFEPDVGHSTVRSLRLPHHDEVYGI